MDSESEKKAVSNIVDAVNALRQDVVSLKSVCKEKRKMIGTYKLKLKQLNLKNVELKDKLLSIKRYKEKQQQILVGLRGSNQVTEKYIMDLKKSLNKLKKKKLSYKEESENDIKKYTNKLHQYKAKYENKPLAIEKKHLQNNIKMYKIKIMRADVSLRQYIKARNLHEDMEKQKMKQHIIAFVTFMMKHANNLQTIHDLQQNIEENKKKFRELCEKEKEIVVQKSLLKFKKPVESLPLKFNFCNYNLPNIEVPNRERKSDNFNFLVPKPMVKKPKLSPLTHIDTEIEEKYCSNQDAERKKAKRPFFKIGKNTNNESYCINIQKNEILCAKDVQFMNNINEGYQVCQKSNENQSISEEKSIFFDKTPMSINIINNIEKNVKPSTVEKKMFSNNITIIGDVLLRKEETEKIFGSLPENIKTCLMSKSAGTATSNYLIKANVAKSLNISQNSTENSNEHMANPKSEMLKQKDEICKKTMNQSLSQKEEIKPNEMPLEETDVNINSEEKLSFPKNSHKSDLTGSSIENVDHFQQIKVEDNYEAIKSQNQNFVEIKGLERDASDLCENPLKSIFAKKTSNELQEKKCTDFSVSKFFKTDDAKETITEQLNNEDQSNVCLKNKLNEDNYNNTQAKIDCSLNPQEDEASGYNMNDYQVPDYNKLGLDSRHFFTNVDYGRTLNLSVTDDSFDAHSLLSPSMNINSMESKIQIESNQPESEMVYGFGRNVFQSKKKCSLFYEGAKSTPTEENIKPRTSTPTEENIEPVTSFNFLFSKTGKTKRKTSFFDLWQ